MPSEIKAAVGVGCAIKEDRVEDVQKRGWLDGTNANRGELGELLTIDKFWEDLNVVFENSKGKIFVIGDFNGRVGSKDDSVTDVVGNHGG